MRGGLHVLFAAVLLAVTALAAVGFFADRVERALQGERAAALAADLVAEQGEPIPEAWVERARALGLATSRQVTFPSVLFLQGRPRLVQVKAVDDAYPLRGRLRIAAPDGSIVSQPPRPGEAVVEPRLARWLGEATQVPLGRVRLKRAGRLLEEPDVGASLFRLAPRLLIHRADPEASGLLGPASRAHFRLLVAGDPKAVEGFRDWLKPRLAADGRLLGVEDGRPELNTAIERARRFLGLAALCASLLAGVAILLAARDYLARSLDEAAILRTLGMTSRQLLWRYLHRLIGIGLAAGLLGCLAGLLLQQGLAHWLGGELGRALPPPGWTPLPVALGHAALLLLGFALPSLWQIRRVPPLRVLRRDLDPPGVSQFALGLAALGAYLALIFWQVQDATLALGLTLGVAGVLAVYALAGWGGLWLLGRRRRSGRLGPGLLGLVRQPGLVLMQLVGFGMGLSLLLLLALVRSDLLDAWQRSLPPDTPNHFLINIQPAEADDLARLLHQAGIPDSGLYPTTRGRLLAISGMPVNPANYQEMRARRLASREYSLGFGDRLQADNRVVAGHWWRPGEVGFSVEIGVAKALGIIVGDELAFEVAGQRLKGPVTSLREVAWDSFNVNFFVQGSQALLERSGVPHTLLTSIYVPPGREGILATLAERFPAVSAIAIGPLLQKVRDIVGRGTRAVEAVFLFTLGAALLVSLAALQLTRAQREREVALMRTLGASRRQVLGALLVEFGGIGLLAGLLSALLANGLGFWLGQRLFGIALGLAPWTWLAGLVAGPLLLGGIAWLAGRPLLAVPPLRVLR